MASRSSEAPERARRGRGHGFLEEHPHVRAFAGSRPFDRRRYLGAMTGVEVGKGVERPAALIEVTSEKRAPVAGQEWVDADGRLSLEVTGKDLIPQWQVLLPPARIRPAPDCRGPPRLRTRLVLPADSEDIGSRSEQGPQQRQLLVSGCFFVERSAAGWRTEQGRCPATPVSIVATGLQAQQAT